MPELELIAVKVAPDMLSRFVDGSRAPVELLDNGDASYRLVRVGEWIEPGDTVAPGIVKVEPPRPNGRGKPVDPNDLPIIRFVKFAKPCSSCGANVRAGERARWNPETKEIFCNTCKNL